MGIGAELVTGKVVNPGAVLTPVTFATGDSGTVKNFQFTAGAFMEEIWALGATAGIVRVRSPRLHDNVQGMRLGYLAADPRPLTPLQVASRLYPQDVLILEQSGGAAETDIVSMLNYYMDLPGVNARLLTWSEVQARMQNLLTVETQHTTGATLGDYGGGLTLAANFDLLKANVDYALLGYVTSVACAAVGYRGPDTGNLRIGGPGTNQRDETRDWFVRMNQITGRPFIPVINAANKGATTVDLVHNAAATAITVQSILAELAT